MFQIRKAALLGLIALVCWFLPASSAFAAGGETPQDIEYVTHPPAPAKQPQSAADKKTAGCLTCHTQTDQATMHDNPGVVLGCTDCHGGDPSVRWTGKPLARKKGHGLENEKHGEEDAHGDPYKNPDYVAVLGRAHVKPRFPKTWGWPKSANPKRTYTLLNTESPEFVRFVNPSDYRVAREACGACHLSLIEAGERSIMATGAMLYGGGAYNNGILPFKNYILGEAYTREGLPAAVQSPPLTEAAIAKGAQPILYPLPAWETVPPGDVFRVFERGGRTIGTQFPEIGLPNLIGTIQRLEENGRPDIRQSNRGMGTGLRVSIPVLNITKTRLNDPNMWFMGTNDHPGDFRTSGCGSCHIVYANDREPRHSSIWAKFGNEGTTQTVDPTIPWGEPGHPLQHAFTRAIPTAQCMNCHMHQPNMFVNTYLGYTMWDYESDAPLMWPKEQKYVTAEERHESYEHNPEAAAATGKWTDVEFLKDVWTDINPKAKDTQFADYHGHGWNFRAVFKRDRKGNLLDKAGDIVSNDDPDKFEKSVHMYSVHAEVGMQCADCHFAQDSHGNGYLHTEVANAVEIRCKDCHGTVDEYPSLRTSGTASPPKGTDLSLLRNHDGKKRFEWVKRKGRKVLVQRSLLDSSLEWEMSLLKDFTNPSHDTYNAKAARNKLMAKGVGMFWGTGVQKKDRAHQEEEMACFSCHFSWTTSCAGCHLPIEANWKTTRHHYEGGETRNFATYNPQVARDQMYQLGKHQTTKNNIIAPVRSSSALVLTSSNINRERIYVQQPPIAASGYSSQAFAPHFPHTARKEETRQCTDCHLSQDNDNNAIMAQLLLHGTNFVNFIGYNLYTGGDGGVETVRVTEWDEPQAVLGSYLHKYAYPDYYKLHVEQNGRELIDWVRGQIFDADGGYSGEPKATEEFLDLTQAGGRTGCLQLRGEYLLTAEGSGGFIAYDVASIANKGISDRILSGPFSPLGHNTRVSSKNATCVVVPTNQSIAPERNQGDMMRGANQEQPFHPIYDYAFVSDSEEGLILVDVNTLADRDPLNNFLKRAVTWNDNGVLNGARFLAFNGHYLYVAADAGVVVLNMDKPLTPKLETVIPIKGARGLAVQFRYLFVTGDGGMRVVDITQMDRPKIVEGAMVPLADAYKVYVARTYAYVAAGRDGLAIIDVENPEKPWVYQMFTGNGTITDARDVVVGSTNASLFGYVADGVNGVKVLQLTSPSSQPNFYGYSPEPKPEVIAWRRTKWPTLSLSKGIDRDRAVDESGHQMAVFGRLGSRPFNRKEMEAFFLDRLGKPWFVSDKVDNAKRVDARPKGKTARRQQAVYEEQNNR